VASLEEYIAAVLLFVMTSSRETSYKAEGVVL
jgi:hypothetical protein